MSTATEERAYEAYSNSVWNLLVQSVDEDSLDEVDDTVEEMISEYYGDGSDPMHPERVESKIIDGLGL